MSAAILAPAARRDLLTAIRRISKDSPAAARALRNSVARAAERIGEHPHIGSLRPDLAGEPYRFVVLTGFPYIIVYNAQRRPPLIDRVLHGAQDLRQILRSL